jgi:membrane-associated phospholipid phosphatase
MTSRVSWWWPSCPPRIPKTQTAWLLAGLGLALFGTSAGLVRSGATSWDVRLLRVLNEVPPAAASVLTPLSRLFLPVGILTVVLVIIVYVVARNRSVLPVAAAALAAAAAWVVADGAKEVAHRSRPYLAVADAVLRQHPARGTSFPSSHTAVTLAIVIALVPFLIRLVATAGITYAVLVGWSRIYLGVHYPLDVLAGAGVGMAVGGAVLLALGMLFRRSGRSANGRNAAVDAETPHGPPSPGGP